MSVLRPPVTSGCACASGEHAKVALNDIMAAITRLQQILLSQCKLNCILFAFCYANELDGARLSLLPHTRMVLLTLRDGLRLMTWSSVVGEDVSRNLPVLLILKLTTPADMRPLRGPARLRRNNADASLIAPPLYLST
ncbi:jg3989 [Pararge aegeria aegeria]|uniref:Jg3989 protein n=1 Tax=Pararge aegeria aegeria TaxID=348720 RepID=A0A8S4QQL2_9NEOP|nr:jg3989 [Pararge aegeria aegeria]